MGCTRLPGECVSGVSRFGSGGSFWGFCVSLKSGPREELCVSALDEYAFR